MNCSRCECYVHDSFPHTKNNGVRCWDCSYIDGIITEKEFITCCGVSLSNTRASIVDGKVIVWVGKKPPWERKSKDYRKTPQYREWRANVFERDGFTCQKCFVVGGELNAHHIKPFAKFEAERYEVENGMTLCVQCHRNIHKKR